MDFQTLCAKTLSLRPVGMAVAMAFFPALLGLHFFSRVAGKVQIGECVLCAQVVCDEPLVMQATKSASDAVMLTFRAGDEVAMDVRFFVERSADGEVFEEVAVVDGTNRQADGWYRFVDLRPRHGHNFYRVRMPCPQGVVYSNVVHVENFLGLEQFVLCPNPTSGLVYVELRNPLASDSQVVVRDAAQRVVFSGTIPRDAYRHRLDLSALPEGVYFVQIMYNNMQGNRTFRLIKW